MSPTFLYLGNPEELPRWCGGHFCSQNYAEPEYFKPFLNRNKFKIFKIIDF